MSSVQKPRFDATPAKTGSHVIVGMSGGVDSSVAALLLKQQGYRVSGIFMQNWEDDDEQCSARQDYRDASAVASRLGIPLTTVNFAEEYWERVFEHFLAEYKAGRTPNPDILCNREIKFRAFLDHARTQGADHIATGHYVRTGPFPNDTALPDSSVDARHRSTQPTSTPYGSQTSDVALLRGLDSNKDQSYFLYTLGQEQLTPSIFPVGEMEKSAVRDLARKAGFATASKKDSTGICFIGERKFTRFLAEYLPATPGEIVTDHGEVVGRHNGLMFHTLGQRQGLGIGGRHDASEAPWYVLDKQLDENRLVVGQGHEHSMLMRKSLRASDMHWVHGAAPSRTFTCSAKVRYRQEDQNVRVAVVEGGDITVNFDKPVRAITPGQSVVLYHGERCLGGAVIDDLDPPARHGVPHSAIAPATDSPATNNRSL